MIRKLLAAMALGLLASCARSTRPSVVMFFSGDEGLFSAELPHGARRTLVSADDINTGWPVSMLDSRRLVFTMGVQNNACSVGVMDVRSGVVSSWRSGARGVAIGAKHILYHCATDTAAHPWRLESVESGNIVQRYSWRALTVGGLGPSWYREAAPVSDGPEHYLYLSQDSTVRRVHAMNGEEQVTALRGLVPLLSLDGASRLVGRSPMNAKTLLCLDKVDGHVVWQRSFDQIGAASEVGDSTFLLCVWSKSRVEGLDLIRVRVEDGSAVTIREGLLMRSGVVVTSSN